MAGGTLNPLCPLSQLGEDIPQQKATVEEAFPSDPSGATAGVTSAPPLALLGPKSLHRFPIRLSTPHTLTATQYFLAGSSPGFL